MGQGKSSPGALRQSPAAKPLSASFEMTPTVFYKLSKRGASEEASYDIINTTTSGLPVEQFFEKYELTTQVLGSGSFAEVRMAKDNRTGEMVAVKIMHKHKTKGRSGMNKKDLEDVRREVAILKNLRHPNIIKVYDYYEDRNTVYITMEYVSGGELFKKIDDMQDFSENDARDIMLTLVHALCYCKNRGVAHRDIKPENILLRKRIFKKTKEAEKGLMNKSMKVAKQKYEIALADFGFAIQVGEEDLNRHALETACGSALFSAPEIINGDSYNYKCDVWSIGILCYLLLSGGYFPFVARSHDELYEQVLAADWDFFPTDAWKDISNHAKSFMERLLVRDPEKRATYEELMDHEWFKPYSVTKTAQAKSVNMEALKRFNARRKILKNIKARQAAQAFKLLMDDLEQDKGDDDNLSKYLKVMKLSDFYTHPEKQTSAEKNHEKSRGMEEIDIEEETPPNLQLLSKRQLTSEYFKDVDEIV